MSEIKVGFVSLNKKICSYKFETIQSNLKLYLVRNELKINNLGDLGRGLSSTVVLEQERNTSSSHSSAGAVRTYTGADRATGKLLEAELS